MEIGVLVRVILKLDSLKMWGLTVDGGWIRPEVIEHNGEWYIKCAYDDKTFEKQYKDFTKDIESGFYRQTHIKVGEE